MADWAVWALLAGVLVAAELFTGTFYLLMLALGMIAAALAAYVGVVFEWQLVVAAVCGIAAVLLLRLSRYGRHAQLSTRDPEASLDIGRTVKVSVWESSGAGYSARVPYRGALWDVDLEPGQSAQVGQFIIREIRGSRLLVAAVDTSKS